MCALPVRLSFELPQESAWSCGFFKGTRLSLKKVSFHWVVASFDPGSPDLEPRQLGTVFEELLDGYVAYVKL